MVSEDGIILAPVDMGKIYRKHDTEFSRDVAIEILLAALAQDPLSRFERKAKVLGAMKHPNIAMIHGLKIAASNARATS